MEYFNESAFKHRVSIALQELKTVLENTRNPVLAESVPHAYNDKYLLTGAFPIHVLLVYFMPGGFLQVCGMWFPEGIREAS
jgi:hypothetical protein